MNDPNIVILAGGISSRMRKVKQASTYLDPELVQQAQQKSKSMISVGDDEHPFLDYVLYNIEKSGYRDVVIVVGERDTSIREYYTEKGGAKQFINLNISYAVQRIPEGRNKPLGTADALLIALKLKPEWQGQKVTVCNSDNLYSVTSLRLLLQDTHPNAMIDYDRSALKFEGQRIEQFSVIRKDSEAFLIDIIEKPTDKDIESVRDSDGRIGVSMNIFRFSFDYIVPFLETVAIHPIRKEKELPEAVRLMITQNPKSMFTIPLSEHVVDLTNLTDISVVQEYLKKVFPKFMGEQY